MAAAGPIGLTRWIVVPAWNEAERIAPLLEQIARELPGWRVVVVDDGSTDSTARVARNAGATVLRHPFNLGYGAALQTGYKWALRRGAELVVQLDADGQHDPADVAALAEPVARGELDVAIGSRFLGAGDYRMGALRRAGRALFAGLLRGFGLRDSDPTSGFQALSRRALALHAGDAFPSDYPDVDVLLAAHRHGLRVGERPVAMHPSPRTSSLHAGLAPLYYVYKMLLALWAASARPRAPGSGGKGDADGP